jgi:large subunit ribosomal protein L5
MATLLEAYRSDIQPMLKDELGRSNKLAVPYLEKIVLNMGLGRAIQEKKIIDEAVDNLRMISGQQPLVTQARVAVSNFRLREGYKVGAKVTMRGNRMYEFMERLIHFAIPRIRDFRGINPKSFDKAGNYSMGVEEVTIFPEINPDNLQYNLGMDVTFVIKNSTGADESRKLLTAFGMPFRK